MHNKIIKQTSKEQETTKRRNKQRSKILTWMKKDEI